MKIEIRNRFTNTVIVEGEYESLKDCLERNRDANLGGAYLGGADLGGTNLGGTNLGGAYLGGAKGYQESHDIFKEIMRRQKVETFTETEWAAIGIITIYSLCWDSIKNRFNDTMGRIFQVLAEQGFDEWQNHWNTLQGGKP